METSEYGKLPDGTPIQQFTLTNAKGAEIKVITFGATLTEVWMPDRKGLKRDIVLGFDSLDGYTGKEPYFGATVGRYANRIANGKFTLDGKSYQLAINDPPNSLHGGTVGFDRRVWKAEPVEVPHAASVKFSYHSPDGEENYPGDLDVAVQYTLTDDNELKLDYTATTDKDTILNLTNHTYWNLAGADSGDVLKQILMLNANSYTPVNANLIPTGEILPVARTAFDFTKPMAIGSRINDPDVQAHKGYDINYVVTGTPGTMRLAARAEDPASGRTMEVWTTQPGIQLYTSNYLDGTLNGKRGIHYKQYGAFALETQHFPDSINQPKFPPVVLHPGQTFHESTTYKFSAK
ncbi:MAG: aldose epimerase family protein [Candidatus Acidiferrales bacterium]